MSKKTKIIVGSVVAVVVIGALTAAIRNKDKDVPRVTTAKVEKIDLVSKVTANGKIQAQRKVDMSALVMGQIVNLAVKEGDHVKKGQLLLQIDRAQLAAQAQGREASLEAMRHDLDAAKATAAQAKLDYERASQQHKGNILAEADLQKAKSNLDTAEANLAATESADELDRWRTWRPAATLCPRRRSRRPSRASSPRCRSRRARSRSSAR